MAAAHAADRRLDRRVRERERRDESGQLDQVGCGPGEVLQHRTQCSQVGDQILTTLQQDVGADLAQRVDLTKHLHELRTLLFENGHTGGQLVECRLDLGTLVICPGGHEVHALDRGGDAVPLTVEPGDELLGGAEGLGEAFLSAFCQQSHLFDDRLELVDATAVEQE